MSATDQALSTIDHVAADGDLAPERPTDVLELDALTEPIVLPDGKRIYPPRLHGEPIDELACALIDTNRPAESTFLRLTGPPGSGKSQLSRCVAYRLWQARGRDVEDRHGVPFYGFVEITGGPSSDEYLFRHEFVPAAGDAGTSRRTAVSPGRTRSRGCVGRRGGGVPDQQGRKVGSGRARLCM